MPGRPSIAIAVAVLLGCSTEPASPPAATGEKAPASQTPPAPSPPVPPVEDEVDVEGKKLLAIGQRIVDASRSGDCVTFMAGVQELGAGSPSTVSASLAARVLEKYGPELQRMIESTGPVIQKCRDDPAWITAMKVNAETWGRRMVAIAGRIAAGAAASSGDCAKLGVAVAPIVPELIVLRRQPPTGPEVQPQLDAYRASFEQVLVPARAQLTQCADHPSVKALAPLL